MEDPSHSATFDQSRIRQVDVFLVCLLRVTVTATSSSARNGRGFRAGMPHASLNVGDRKASLLSLVAFRTDCYIFDVLVSF